LERKKLATHSLHQWPHRESP